MKFLALIPARYASSRFPGKPLADIAGKPMIQHVYERASQVFDACWVATDDGRISDAVEFFGGRVVMTSPDHRSGTDRCREALDTIERRTGERFDVVVNIQGDEPFVAAEQLQQLATCFNLPDTDIATSVKPFGKGEDIFNPYSPKVVISREGYALYFSRSVVPYLRNEPAEEWQAKHPFLKHLGIYAYRSKVLREIADLKPGVLETAESLEQLRWLENGFRIRVAVTDRESLAVDTPDDLARV
ncbi:MAG: 3-deoxy-manno-octulosonate cytidylyltransferase, partial [Rikenellaceae bacterium]|nr:3-deoxy-manno-octulosonate cytidylyltransferase [Rikenellaceae bacterium]